jgi:hypothetical protein
VLGEGFKRAGFGVDALGAADVLEHVDDRAGAHLVEVDLLAAALDRAGELVLVVGDEDDGLLGLLERACDLLHAAAVLAAEDVVGLVEDDQLAAVLGRRPVLALAGEALRGGAAGGGLLDRVRGADVAGVELDRAPAHVVGESQRGAGLA